MRVIAGEARGVPLRAPAGWETRPTSDLVRGAIFNALSTFENEWNRALDLFAGSGALGIEALSRGVQWVDFVEMGAAAVAVIRKNLDATKFTERAAVHQMRVERSFHVLEGPYDIILADPPYGLPNLSAILEELARSRLAGPRSILVVEHSRRQGLPEQLEGFQQVRTRRHGDTEFSIYLQEGRV